MTAGMIVSQIALYKGNNTAWMPAYGAAMRGGTANCTVHYGEGPVYNPGQEQPDLLLAMNEPSFLKFCSIVKPGGYILYNADMMSKEVLVKAEKNVQLVGVHCNQIANELGHNNGANIVMVGAITCLLRDFTMSEALEGMLDMFEKKGKKKYEALNRDAFVAGYNELAQGK